MSKPMPYGLKVKKLYEKQFYLARETYSDFLFMLEHGQIRSNREAVDFIEQHGDWTHG